ncbi:MAG: hypothetical protein GXO73_11850, partial [Calditrichaeota bacterium]|nr:hypothetical protein [Calditrichota bacterium]
LSRLHAASGEETTEAIVSEVGKFVGAKTGRHDDLTFVVVKFTNDAAGDGTAPS